MPDVNYEKIEDGELQKWDKIGIIVEGVLERYKQQTTAMGEGHVYEVNTKDGIVPFFAPSLLHKKLERIEIGKVVKITYLKKSKTAAGTDLKHFEVLHAEPTEANLKSVGVEMYKKDEGQGDGEDISDLPS